MSADAPDCSKFHCPVCNDHVPGWRSKQIKLYDGPPFETRLCGDHGMFYVPEAGEPVSVVPGDIPVLAAKLGVTASVGFWVAYMAGYTLAQRHLERDTGVDSFFRGLAGMLEIKISPAVETGEPTDDKPKPRN